MGMVKRCFDVIISLVAILILLPFWIIISLCIFLEDPGSVIYKQKRVGQNVGLFTIFKFRSMRHNTISPLTLGAVKHNHALVTKTGYVIRRFKLDETPQFLNVLLGDMSLIGPRPCLPERIPQMTLLQKQRFDCLPGLTGWAEVNGNVELSFEEQVSLDVWYVQHQSFLLDVKIFFKTIAVVFFGSLRNEAALAAAKKLNQ